MQLEQQLALLVVLLRSRLLSAGGRAGPHGDVARPWVVEGRLGGTTLVVTVLLDGAGAGLAAVAWGRACLPGPGAAGAGGAASVGVV